MRKKCNCDICLCITHRLFRNGKIYTLKTDLGGMHYGNIVEMIGNTPMLEIGNGVYGKVEYMNPTGSHKDRTALWMLRDASSVLKKGGSVIEYTSGNTGISVAFISGIMGYRAIILVPENISEEKINLIRALGGKIVKIGKDADGHEYARKLARETGGMYLNQTENLANFRAHYESTAREIIRDLPKIRCFVMGVGTGGTIYGIGKYLKERDEKIRVVALIPKNSYLQEELFGRRDDDEMIFEGFSYHSFSGLFKRALDEGIVDDIIVTDSKEAITGMRSLLARGVIGGATSGANYHHAMKLSKKYEKTATIIADSILRYPVILKRLVGYDSD